MHFSIKLFLSIILIFENIWNTFVIITNNPYPLILLPNPLPILIYSYFTTLLHYTFIISSFNISKLSQSVLFYFPGYVHYT